MNYEELVVKAIKHQLLNELFSETLSDLSQDVILIKNERDLDVVTIIRKLATDDLLITNANYRQEKKDFSIIDKSGDIILTVSPDGHSINSKSFEYYLEDANSMKELLKIYDQVRTSSKAYTVVIDDKRG